MTLRTRLTLIYTIAAAALVTVIGFVVVAALRAGLTDNMDASLRARADDVVAQLDGSAGSPVAVEAVTGLVVQVLDARGHVLDGSDAVGNRSLAAPPLLSSANSRDVTADRTLIGAGGARTLRMVIAPASRHRFVVVAADRGVVDRPVRRTAGLLIAVSAVLVGAAGVGSWLQARAALRAVEHMRGQAQAMTVPGASRGLQLRRGRDELFRLAETFNELLRRLHGAVERERAFVADAGHELRTPLTVLRGELELAMRPGRTPTELRETVVTAQRQTERLTRLAEDLLQLTLVERDLADRFDLVGLLEECAATCRPAAGVRIVVRGSAPMPAVGNSDALHRAVVNLLSNAVRYAPAGSAIDVDAVVRDDRWAVTVRDRGPGFPPDFLARAFDRFSQADPTRHRTDRTGAGLGLAIVAATMTSHGGQATVANHPDGGALVSVSWPFPPVTRS